jgi:hypothetical protein
MSKSSLTKIITFTPFYMIQNCLQTPVVVWELDSVDHERDLIEIGPGQTTPFWPNFGAEAVILVISSQIDDRNGLEEIQKTSKQKKKKNEK